MKPVKAFLALIILAMLLSACGAPRQSGTAPDAGENDFHIVTSFYPIYVLTINVAGDIPGVRVTNMTEPQSGCLHDYELSPADMKTLEDADLFIINGAGMEAFMDEVKKAFPDLAIVEAAKDIPLIIDEHTGEPNPHVWVSISNAILQVENIREALKKSDPAHKEQYERNAGEFREKLQALRDRMHDELKDIGSRDIVTFHEAFPYFAREFGLNIAAVIEREPGTEPTAVELQETIETINALGVKAIFAEPQYSARAAETIASETGAKVYLLDPLVTGPKDADPDSYIETMEKNLQTLIEALK
ncbi:MAG TPA: metal ABC transporter substrate-binding protein [Thermoclostridium sp.]|nr:metal ABC transporter substrate-binding protein [Thermoclostridium sp.]